MHRIIQEQHIAALIAKEMMGMISGQEQSELQEWLAESEEHRQIYADLRQMRLGEELACYRGIGVAEGWKKYQQKYGKGRKRIIRRWPVAAAVAVVVLASGLWLGLQLRSVSGDLAAIRPGMSKATLVLEDGSLRELSDSGRQELIEAGCLAETDGKTIRYKAPDRSPQQDGKMAFNELRIPRGGEYRLVLADGTRVWLNSQTTLRYPVCFAGDSREVTLQGEAYFEVAKDKSRPFIVRTGEEVKVQVLGTSFNVRAYADEKQVAVVLEEGAVRMRAVGQEVLLKPGERTCYDAVTRNMDTQPVNTRNYTEWRNGQFSFIRQRVEDIFKDLARWYDVEVVYRQEAVKDIVFSGNVKKYDSIRPLLEAIEIAGGVSFEIEGNVLYVDIAYK